MKSPPGLLQLITCLTTSLNFDALKVKIDFGKEKGVDYISLLLSEAPLLRDSQEVTIPVLNRCRRS